MKVYTGNPGNDVKLAEQALYCSFMELEPVHHVSSFTLNTSKLIDHYLFHTTQYMVIHNCLSSNTKSRSRRTLKTVRYCLQFSRGNLRQVARLLASHCKLHKHMHRIGPLAVHSVVHVS